MRNFQGYFSRTFQGLKLQFPGLSRTEVLFQDFPEGVETLCTASWQAAWRHLVSQRNMLQSTAGAGTYCLGPSG